MKRATITEKAKKKDPSESQSRADKGGVVNPPRPSAKKPRKHNVLRNSGCL